MGRGDSPTYTSCTGQVEMFVKSTDRSYHGGSFRGGYGHGLAADLVSVNGDNDAQKIVELDRRAPGVWNRATVP